MYGVNVLTIIGGPNAAASDEAGDGGKDQGSDDNSPDDGVYDGNILYYTYKNSKWEHTYCESSSVTYFKHIIVIK